MAHHGSIMLEGHEKHGQQLASKTAKANIDICESASSVLALLNPETPILIQKRHPYTGIQTQKRVGTMKTHF
jgi:hypothetical protein